MGTADSRTGRLTFAAWLCLALACGGPTPSGREAPTSSSSDPSSTFAPTTSGGGSSATAGDTSGHATGTASASSASATLGTGSTPTSGASGTTTCGTGCDPLVVHTAVISTTHRFVPGAMFGGWGPHLGHLVEDGSNRLVWADDACEQTPGPDACDVSINRRIDYHLRTEDTWTKIASLPLPATVQQNTASVATTAAITTYGVNVATAGLVACTMSTTTWQGACANLPLPSLPANSNYIGAARTPDGWTMLWHTSVAEGAGTFSWYVNYGGGWNGPRTGSVAPFNDAAYVAVAFPPPPQTHRFSMHAQFASGTAPNWTFTGALGDGDASSANPVSFVPMAAAAGDPVVSTNDVVIDPLTGDTHVLARTEGGAVAYVHRPADGTFAAPVAILPATYRARWILLADDRLMLTYGRNGEGLFLRVFPPDTRTPQSPLNFEAASEQAISLPEGYEQIYAIYPEVAIYQDAAPAVLRLALVGATREYEVRFVEVSA